MTGNLSAQTVLDPRRLVFVGGLHRSGTTPLTRALSQHPDIGGLTDTGVTEDEGQHLQDVYPAARSYGGAGRFALDPRSHLTEASDLVRPDTAQRLSDAWRPYWDLERRYLVEKSPPNIVMNRFLQAVYPGSGIIVVMRHPVIVALSTVKWRRILSRHAQNHASLDTMLDNWVHAYTTFLGDLPHLDRVTVLRYEDLVTEPAQTLRAVEELLELDRPVPHDSLRASHSAEYEQRWAAMERSLLGRRQRARLISRYGEAVGRFGYDLADVRALGPLELPAPRR